MAALSAEDFARQSGVSRETLDRLRLYAERLAAWNRRINLVGRATLADVWRRHFLDSAQLYPLVPPLGPGGLADLGSGAGFPGLVLAIMGAAPVHLVESDRKKAAFLREVARETGCSPVIHTARIEHLDPLACAVVTARALAPLPKLLGYVHRHLGENGTALLLKGESAAEELTLARDDWKMAVTTHPSASDARARILEIHDLRPSHP